MRLLIAVILLSCQALAQTTLVPFYSDATYQRDEPVNPPWFITNSGQCSKLYHSGVYVSQECGTNDLDMLAAWAMHAKGAKVGVVDMTAHGDRSCALVATMSPASQIYRHELARWYAATVAAGILDCLSNDCRVILVETGFSTPDNALSNACIIAAGSLIVYPAPDQEGNLDASLVDYPYRWGFSNVLPVTSLDRNGLHYTPSAIGSNCTAAPGRNIVAAGTYSSGTSWAAAITAGAAALLVDRLPDQPPAAYVEILRGVLRPAKALTLRAPALAITPKVVVVIGDRTNLLYTLEQSSNFTNWFSVARLRSGESMPLNATNPHLYYRATIGK